MARTLQKREFRVELTAKNLYSNALGIAESRYSRFGKTVSSAIGNTAIIAAKSMAVLGAAAVGVGVTALKFSTDFNAAMANVATLIPGNIARIKELKGNVQDLSIATGQSTDDLAGGLFEVISAFGDTAETTKKLTINARAAKAGMSTVTEAIKLTSAVTKGYGDTSAAAIQKVADLAFMTNVLGQTSFPELASNMGKVVPLAVTLGMEVEELFGIYATLTGVTGTAAEVQTQLGGVMRAMITPTKEMTAAIKKLGYDGAQALVGDKGIVGAVKALTDKTDGSVEAIGKLFSRAEATTGVLTLMGSQAEKFNKVMEDMRDVAGEAERAYDEQTKGINLFGHQVEQAQRIVAVVFQKMGDILTPFASNVLGAMLEKMVAFNKELDSGAIDEWAESVNVNMTAAAQTVMWFAERAKLMFDGLKIMSIVAGGLFPTEELKDFRAEFKRLTEDVEKKPDVKPPRVPDPETTFKDGILKMGILRKQELDEVDKHIQAYMKKVEADKKSFAVKNFALDERLSTARVVGVESGLKLQLDARKRGLEAELGIRGEFIATATLQESDYQNERSTDLIKAEAGRLKILQDSKDKDALINKTEMDNAAQVEQMRKNIILGIRQSLTRGLEQEMLNVIEIGKFSLSSFRDVVAQEIKITLIQVAAKSAIMALWHYAMSFAAIADWIPGPAAAGAHAVAAGQFAAIAGGSLLGAAVVQQAFALPKQGTASSAGTTLDGGTSPDPFREKEKDDYFAGQQETAIITQTQAPIQNNITVVVEGSIVGENGMEEFALKLVEIMQEFSDKGAEIQVNVKGNQ